MKSAIPTLAHAASLAGVSENTVSRVIRNKEPIAEKTRHKVLSAIETLGYVPNRAAGSLASSSSLIIGVILPSLSNIVFPEVLRGIHTALTETRYQAMVGVSDYDLRQEEKILTSLLAWHPAAIITTGFDHTVTTRKLLENSRIRVAELMDIDNIPIDIAVGLSHHKAGMATADYLLSRGYRNIAYVGHDWRSDRRAFLRYGGLREGLQGAACSVVATELFDGGSSARAGRESLAKLMTTRVKIDAVVFSNDDMAIGGYMHCLAEGLNIPDEIALFGFNGLDIGQTLPLPLSTIRSNRFLIGKMAVEKLLESSEPLSAPQIFDTGFEIVVGATT